jgi:succinyl-CoA synthetase alpha subunit
MSILINKNSKVIVQGITGRDGKFHTKQMLDYGTNIVAGVVPGKENIQVHGVDVYSSVKDAMNKTGANTSVLYVPAPYAMDALFESIEAGIKLIVCITEGVPKYDSLKIKKYLKLTNTRLIGPNCPGLIVPGVSKVGIIPGSIAKKGNVGVVSKSGTLTYEVVNSLTKKGIGQSTCIGIGGDPIIGTDFVDVLELFNNDDETKYIVMIGEIGGDLEEKAAEYIKKNVNKPVVCFIAGKTAPKGKQMGHAGAIISRGKGTWEDKVNTLKDAGVYIVDKPSQIAEKISELMIK